MGSFNTPTVVYSAVRPFKVEISTFNTFDGIATTLMSDSTMGLKKKEWNALSLKGLKNVINPEGEPVADVTVICSPKKSEPGFPSICRTTYPWILDSIDNNFVERNLDDGYTAVEDSDKRAWSYKFNIETAAGDDCYLQITNKKAILSSYNLPATLQTVNTWCNTIPAMDNDITA